MKQKLWKKSLQSARRIQKTKQKYEHHSKVETPRCTRRQRRPCVKLSLSIYVSPCYNKQHSDSCMHVLRHHNCSLSNTNRCISFITNKSSCSKTFTATEAVPRPTVASTSIYSLVACPSQPHPAVPRPTVACMMSIYSLVACHSHPHPAVPRPTVALYDIAASSCL